MSGGSYDYAFRKLDEIAEELRGRHAHQPHVVALATHFEELAKFLGEADMEVTLTVRLRGRKPLQKFRERARAVPRDWNGPVTPPTRGGRAIYQ